MACATIPIGGRFSAISTCYMPRSVELTDSESAPSLTNTQSLPDILEVCLTLKYRLWPLEKWSHYQHRAYIPTRQQFDRADNTSSGVLCPVYSINSCFSFLFSEITKSISACSWKSFGNGKGVRRWHCHRRWGAFFFIIINKHFSGIYILVVPVWSMETLKPTLSRVCWSFWGKESRGGMSCLVDSKVLLQAEDQVSR